MGGIEPVLRGVLERLQLISPEDVSAAAPAAPATTTTPAAPPTPKAHTPPQPVVSAPPITRAEEEELEILFDDAEDGDDASIAAPAAAHNPLEDIDFCLSQGMAQDALSRIADARRAGVEGAAIDALEARARASAAPMEEVAFDDEASLGGDSLDEADLSSITAALEAEFGADGAAELSHSPAEPATEQSVDDVFDSFKEHVRAAVEVGDYRTHYDLGIAYKEMGLVDDALAEFRIASGTPELYRESCSMLGLCHWERGEADEAIRWYRAAIDAPGSDEVPLAGLRYELAEMLESRGDVRGAYDLLALVLAEEPGYRDVDHRLATLRSRLGL